MNQGVWGGELMNSTIIFAQEIHSAIGQFELQGERPDITVEQVRRELCMVHWTV